MQRRVTRDRYLSEPELARFMDQVRQRQHKHQPRDHALFALLCNTGIRPSEALTLRASDCRLDGADPWIVLHRPHKPGHPRPVNELAIPDAVAEPVRVHAETIAGSARLFPFTGRQAARLFHYYAALAGLPVTFKIYSLRHAVGRRLWRCTRDLRLMQAIMGHTRLKSAMSYIHLPASAMRRALESAGAL